MDYTKISKDTIGHLYAGYKSLNDSPLAAELKVLLELRVSQINGCGYCCNLHTNIEAFYNSQRLHSSIGYLSPMQFEMAA